MIKRREEGKYDHTFQVLVAVKPIDVSLPGQYYQSMDIFANGDQRLNTGIREAMAIIAHLNELAYGELVTYLTTGDLPGYVN